MPDVKSRREQYSDATREAVLDSAQALFADRGFGATTLEDVAADARVTRGAVYHHFANKKALFEAVLDRLEQDTVDHLTEVSRAAETPWDAAMTALDEFLDRCRDHVYGRLVWQEGPIALGWARWRECEEKYAYGLVDEILRAGLASGQMAPGPVAITSRLVFSLLGAAGLALAEADEDDKPRVHDECARMIRRLLGGLRAGT